MIKHEMYLQLALQQAQEALADGCYPVGAAIVDPLGQIVATGRNRVASTGDPTAHAEIDAMRKARMNGYALYTTLEPCLMCTGALPWAKLGLVVWAANDPVHGRARSLPAEHRIAEPLPHLARASRDLLAQYRASAPSPRG